MTANGFAGRRRSDPLSREPTRQQTGTDMTCAAFTLQNGLFSSSSPFISGGQTAGLAVRPKRGNSQFYEIVYHDTVVVSEDRGIFADGAVAWMLFPGIPSNKTIAVRLAKQGSTASSFRIDVWDVTNASSPQRRRPRTGLLSGSASSQMHCHPSLDSKAYMLWIGDGSTESHSHKVFRSDQDNADPVCSYGPMAGAGDRTCRNNNGTIEICRGGTPMSTCPLPQGSPDGSPCECQRT